ncbi:MAG: polysaccharide deacetylase family protein [Myxococcales bacterium]|nr:polysaccharide deacetylase family protein [Myxococcales bacterium]
MTRLSLTFDNGPHPDITPKVLDALRERGLRALFFVVGKHLASPVCRRLVARAVAEGHVVGNHSFSHRVPLGKDPRPDAIAAEITATEALLAPLWSGPRLFRPFGGRGAIGPHLLTRPAVDYLLTHGYTCVLWNEVPRDWQDAEGWPHRALAACAARAHTVLVLHDVPSACAARLGSFLDRARERGVDVVQDLPADCTPIVEGRIAGDLRGLVAQAIEA